MTSYYMLTYELANVVCSPSFHQDCKSNYWKHKSESTVLSTRDGSGNPKNPSMKWLLQRVCAWIQIKSFN